jgi:hypothetical protein
MRRALQIRAALAAAALLAQLALPFAHALAFAEGLPRAGDGGASIAASTAHPSTVPDHDPILCPICSALHQASSGIGRAPAASALPLRAAPLARGHEPSLVLPRTPDLAAAAPRAPPLRSLAFA